MIKRTFSIRETQHIIKCFDGNYASTSYEMWTGASRRDVSMLKRNIDQIRWVVDNFKKIPFNLRKKCANEAIWHGVDFSDKKTLNKFIDVQDTDQDPDQEPNDTVEIIFRDKEGYASFETTKDSKLVKKILKIVKDDDYEYVPELIVKHTAGGSKTETEYVIYDKAISKILKHFDK